MTRAVARTLSRLAAPALLACFAAVACGGEPPPARGRVLLVGIDGASPRVVEPLLAAGRLPNLARVARDGVSGRLRSRVPLASPRIWNTIATGKLPEKHGIEWFVREDEGHTRLLLSSDRKVHALWNIASGAGLRVGVVNFWNTYPPERIDGVMVSDHLLASELETRRTLGMAESAPAGPLVYPLDWRERVEALLDSDARVVPLGEPLADHEALPGWIFSREFVFGPSTRDDEALTRIALAIESETHPALLLCLLPGIDRVSHFLWGGLEAADLYPPALRPSASERVAMVKALEAYYVFTDALIGALVARFGPEDLVIVVSDHGFEAGTPLDYLTGKHEGPAAAEGVIFARGRGIPAGGETGPIGIEDLTPTILAWLGLPVALDMDGHPAAFALTGAVATLPTYDSAPVERLALSPSGAEDEIVDRLRELGYLEQR
jgi:hypothetical protein